MRWEAAALGDWLFVSVEGDWQEVVGMLYILEDERKVAEERVRASSDHLCWFPHPRVGVGDDVGDGVDVDVGDGASRHHSCGGRHSLFSRGVTFVELTVVSPWLAFTW